MPDACFRGQGSRRGPACGPVPLDENPVGPLILGHRREGRSACGARWRTRHRRRLGRSGVQNHPESAQQGGVALAGVPVRAIGVDDPAGGQVEAGCGHGLDPPAARTAARWRTARGRPATGAARQHGEWRRPPRRPGPGIKDPVERSGTGLPARSAPTCWPATTPSPPRQPKTTNSGAAKVQFRFNVWEAPPGRYCWRESRGPSCPGIPMGRPIRLRGATTDRPAHAPRLRRRSNALPRHEGPSRGGDVVAAWGETLRVPRVASRDRPAVSYSF